MNIEQMPIFKFELENMREKISYMLLERSNEFDKMLQPALEKAIAEYPLEQKVKDIVNATLTTEIENYFKYGQGNQSIKAIIENAFGSATND